MVLIKQYSAVGFLHWWRLDEFIAFVGADQNE